jgi:hypothetical protein
MGPQSKNVGPYTIKMEPQSRKVGPCTNQPLVGQKVSDDNNRWLVIIIWWWVRITMTQACHRPVAEDGGLTVV